MAAGGTITLAQPNTGFSSVTGWLVTDITANWHVVGNTAGGAGSITLTLTGQAIAAGDSLTVTVAGVTNPGSGTYSNFTVATSVDTVPVAAPPFTIGPSGAAGVIVTPNPAGVGGHIDLHRHKLVRHCCLYRWGLHNRHCGQHVHDQAAQQPGQLHDHGHHDPVRVWDSFGRQRHLRAVP